MSSIEIHVNLMLALFVVIVSALIGYAFRSAQIKRLKLKIIALENEMLQNHAEILSLQKEISKSEVSKPFTTLPDNSNTPVVNIKNNSLTLEGKSTPKKHRTT